MPLHDPPDIENLLEAVREFLQDELRPVVEENSRLRTHLTMALNVIAVVERQLKIGAQQEADHAQSLATLGVSSEAELAAAIREGRLDGQRDKVFAVLQRTTASKLLVANPRFLQMAQREAEAAAARAAKKAGAGGEE